MPDEILIAKLNECLSSLLMSELALNNAENAVESARRWRRETDKALYELLTMTARKGIALPDSDHISVFLNDRRGFVVHVPGSILGDGDDFHVFELTSPEQFLGAHSEDPVDG